MEEQLHHRLTLQPPAADVMETEKNNFGTLHLILHNAPDAYLQSFLNIQELTDKVTVPQNIPITIHVDKQPDGEHARQFNLSTTSEVSMLLPNQDRGSQDSCTYKAQRRKSWPAALQRHPQELQSTVT